MAGAGVRFMKELTQKIPLANTQQLIGKAIADPALMAALLNKGATPTARRMMERQINAFVLQTLVPVPTGE